MHQDFLSDIELYYCDEIDSSNNSVTISDDEVYHAINVMRNSEGSILYVTDGKGAIYKTEIIEIRKSEVSLAILNVHRYQNDFANIFFCIPRLKNKERFEFSIEKCVELGITNFIIFESDRTVSKGDKRDKWHKMGISAMKQSLRAYLPDFVFEESIDSLVLKRTDKKNKIYLLDQKAENHFLKIIDEVFSGIQNSYFIFGPEGGISERELYILKEASFVRLTGNRLRSETAIISAGILLGQIL